METMGEKIVQLRKQAGLSQEELAYELGVSRQAICKWETDKRKPKTINIESLCKFFKVSSEYFLFDNSDKTAMKESVATSETEENSFLKACSEPLKVELPSKIKSRLWIIAVITSSTVMAVSVILCILFSVINYQPTTGVQTSESDEPVLWIYLILGSIFVIASVCLILLLIYKKTKKL